MDKEKMVGENGVIIMYNFGVFCCIGLISRPSSFGFGHLANKWNWNGQNSQKEDEGGTAVCAQNGRTISKGPKGGGI